AAASGSREAQAIPVEYVPAPPPGAKTEEGSSDPKVGVARDVGGQGLGLLVEEELEVGGCYDLALRVFGEVFRMSATVVYEEPGGDQGEWRYFLRPDKKGLHGLANLARAIEEERLRQRRSRAMECARKAVRRPAKRRASRYQIELPVQTDGSNGDTFWGVTIDVSTTGAALRADRELAVGTEIGLRVIHPELPEHLNATVVSCSPREEENTWRLGLDLSTPNAALARIASPPDAPLFLDPGDVDHDAMTQRGLRNNEDMETETAVDSEAGMETEAIEETPTETDEPEEDHPETPTAEQVPQRVDLSSVRDTLAEIESSAEADPLLEAFAEELAEKQGDGAQEDEEQADERADFERTAP
ncbi:MAG: hypothetical protein CME06_08815, partial [Gemmatimonadetes bacterium]|nr:hypothetical protein [Gemmatimonadota bacterium]